MHAALADVARMGATTAAAARSHRHTAWLAAAFAVDLIVWGIAIWKGRDVEQRRNALLAQVERFAKARHECYGSGGGQGQGQEQEQGQEQGFEG